MVLVQFYRPSALSLLFLCWIAIVGGGIGGTSAAYYLRQLFGKDAQLDLFEADQIGGRLAVINIDGNNYEAGGSIIHPKNKYMVDFAKQFGKGYKLLFSFLCTY